MEIMHLIANRDIYPVYQPIVNMATNDIVGYEALTRSPNNMPPNTLFRYASECGLIRNLDTLCIHNAIENAPNGKPIFINVMPITLVWLTISGKIDKILNKASQLIVFEIVEIERIPNNLEELSLAVDKIRAYGFQIAIDDISQGFGRLHLIPLFCPDYIKIDRTLAVNFSKHHNAVKKTIINLAAEIGTEVIAEGVETKEEFEALYNLGVEMFQGYYFAKPGQDYLDREKITGGSIYYAENRS